MNAPFSPEEIALVRQLYPAAPRAELLTALPGRSYDGIRLKARQMDLHRARQDKGASRATSWPPEQLAQLRAEYARRGPTALAIEWGRHPQAVASMGHRLGLTGQRQVVRQGTRTWLVYSKAENDVLRARYAQAEQAELLAALPGRSWVSICNQASRLGLRRRQGTRTRWPEADLQLVREHYATRGAEWLAARLGRPAGTVSKAARRLGIRYEGPRLGGLPPKPEAARKPRPARRVPVPKVKAAPKPKAVKPAKPSPAPKPPKPEPTKRSPATPNLNAQKAAQQAKKAEQASKPAGYVSADDVRRLDATHPARIAYTRAAHQGMPAAQAAFHEAMKLAA